MVGFSFSNMVVNSRAVQGSQADEFDLWETLVGCDLYVLPVEGTKECNEAFLQLLIWHTQACSW